MQKKMSAADLTEETKKYVGKSFSDFVKEED